MNAGFTLVDCLREIEEQKAKAWGVMTAYGNGECVNFISMKVWWVTGGLSIVLPKG